MNARRSLKSPASSRSMIALAAALICSGALTACGGGGSDGAGPAADDSTPSASTGDGNGGSPSNNDATPVVATKSVPVTVIDGPIEKAVVCVDKNLNGACDAGEPSGTTDADGKVALQVPLDDEGKYPIVAVVGTDAVDRDHGPVTQPFTLKAPAGRPDVVSPLTTLVQAQVDAAGISVDDAATLVQSQLGLSASPFADFTAAGDAASTQAGNAARLLVVVTQQHNAALAAAVGTTDSSGSTITRQDLDKAVSQALLNMLPSLADTVATALNVPADQVAAAIASAATSLVSEAGLSADKVAAVVGSTKMIEQASSGTAPTDAGSVVGWNVRWFQFTDVDNWFVRANETTAEQAVPDANGLLRFTDNRIRKTGSGSEELVWGETPAWTRPELYWDGAAWWNCPTDFAHTMTPRDANGVSQSTYCKTILTTSKRGTRDIGGQKMVDVVREIRAYPLQDTFGISYGGWANWGPNPDSGILGSATFPAGSKLYFMSLTDTAYPDAYNPTDPNNLLKLNKSDSAGGTSCPLSGATDAASFDEVLAHNGGTPCVYTASEATGARNEWWGNSTIRIALLSNATTPPTSYYSGDLDIRAALAADGTARYYACAMRAANTSVTPVVSASPRNCDLAATGSYRIETLGDSRVMRFAGLPTQLNKQGFERIFVERGGKVYYGSRTKSGSGHSIRLNDTGAKALFIQLGLPQLATD